MAEPTKSFATEMVEKYNIRHHYRGSFKMDGDDTVYNDKEAAIRAASARHAAEGVEDELGDIIPKGYESYTLKENYLVRGSIMELPMNERYTADGRVNPEYDREWVFGWAYKDRADISDHRAKGYNPVDYKEFQKDVKSGRIPAYVGDLVHEDGSFTAYGDVVLMKAPRYLWRQRQNAKLHQAKDALDADHREGSEFYRKAGVELPPEVADKLDNSLSIQEY